MLRNLASLEEERFSNEFLSFLVSFADVVFPNLELKKKAFRITAALLLALFMISEGS